ncbi:hypothetical protein [Phenylobacterium sp.]|uniref:hypothetical protein n=1 Tax=Phenylobacterium sp. TaxID=1871053 RepID=UPI002E37C409|nr:hypothetical protein [Phenylobacterium sp.]HEX3363673.1 hypothetical protein [Phenylobacterium sp.]
MGEAVYSRAPSRRDGSSAPRPFPGNKPAAKRVLFDIGRGWWAAAQAEGGMFKMSGVGRLELIAAALISLWSGTAAAQDAPPSHTDHRSCFFIHEWQGWKSPSPMVLYLRINRRDVYRVDLTSGSPNLQRSDMHLISETRGSDVICSALDLQLSVADTQGFREPLIAKSLTRLSAEEIAAIPHRFLP